MYVRGDASASKSESVFRPVLNYLSSVTFVFSALSARSATTKFTHASSLSGAVLKREFRLLARDSMFRYRLSMPGFANGVTRPAVDELLYSIIPSSLISAIAIVSMSFAVQSSLCFEGFDCLEIFV
jgi:hypothetical protein